MSRSGEQKGVPLVDNYQAANPRAYPAQTAALNYDNYCKDLEKLQKIDFVLVELTLYLDTHPNDLQAIQQYNQLAQTRRGIADAFQRQYGPLMSFGHSFTQFPWQWVQTPWPWQV
jgi:spore coat protein JB